jgi:RecA-family ATPase
MNINITADQARVGRYCTQAFDSAVATVRGAANGHRNETLNKEALGLAGLIHLGVFSQADIERELTEAATACGLPANEVSDTLKSALNAGIKTPRDIPESNSTRTRTARPAARPQQPASAPDEAQASKDIAEAFWRNLEPADDRQRYITEKHGLPDGMRISRAGELVAPLYTLDGELAAVQVIGKDKKFPKGNRPGAFKDACFIAGGPPKDGDTIYIVEGLGQGWTVHQATRKPAACCYGVGRMAGVAQALHVRFPKAHLVLVADIGKETQMSEIARAVGGSWVACPPELGDGGDINDLHVIDGLQAAADLLANPKAPAKTSIGWSMPAAIDDVEWMAARPTPDCIVENYLFADVGILIAPGGTGKTTLLLFEAIHIALDIPLYGLHIRRPGPVVILTAEDSREMLVARLRSIAEEMRLTDEQIQKMMTNLRISDVSGEGFKLTEVFADVVTPAPTVEQIITECRDIKPALIVIDPAISFGIGESRVNDAEQGLVEAARKLRRALNCCVRYVHHSGKQNARDRAVDQYAGRGGSAFADGARMVAVLQTMTATEWLEATGHQLEDGDTGLRLARPKISYAPPAGDIFILRSGYAFHRVESTSNGSSVLIESNANMIWRLLASELEQGRRHSKNSLETVSDLRRADMRRAVSWLEASGRIDIRNIPNRSSNRGASRYLHPVASPTGNGEPKANHAE